MTLVFKSIKGTYNYNKERDEYYGFIYGTRLKYIGKTPNKLFKEFIKAVNIHIKN